VKLAVSNIAWPRDQDEAVAELFRRFGITGIEVAPTKLFPQPLEATDAEIDMAREFWTERGIAIVAAQALLFGKPELTIFESKEVRERTLKYLKGIVRLCARLRAGALVFGSPKNRRIGSMPRVEADRIATEFFTQLGEAAASAGTCIVLEANPPVYGADYITTAAEAIELVTQVNHPGWRLHLDTGCMALAGDSIPESFARGTPLLRHFHVSAPNLDPPHAAAAVDHAVFAAELRRIGYGGWVSLEMRETQPFEITAFAECLEWYALQYGNPR
jgi:sugar phosphate isomerase/epimerase